MKNQVPDMKLPELLCPACDSEYLTYDAVHIFNRKEDAKYGQHVTVYDGEVHQDVYMSDNPSPRRGGIRIKFYCERCEGAFYLVLAQHKGTTQISWEKYQNQYAHYQRVDKK
ncbi:hypothetical protein FJJ57_22140 [Salmonella enterica subsp. enterica]|nr:hypothetical protein [Salmonella enterica subsp. enterica serovar Newport]